MLPLYFNSISLVTTIHVARTEDKVLDTGAHGVWVHKVTILSCTTGAILISNTVISNVNKSDQLCSCRVHADLADCNRPWFAKLKACDLEKGINHARMQDPDGARLMQANRHLDTATCVCWALWQGRNKSNACSFRDWLTLHHHGRSLSLDCWSLQT